MIRKVKLGSVAIEAKESVSSIPSGTPIVGLEHLDPGELTLSRWDVTDKTTFTKTFKKGDVLFGRRRAYLKKAAVAPFDGVCSGDITVIRAMPNKIRPGLLAFLIQNDRFFAHAVKNSDGSLSPRAKWASLKEFAFALDDDLSVQDRILDMLVSINNTKLEYKKVLAKCDELIKSRFVEMFGDPSTGSQKYPIAKLGTLFEVTSSKRIFESQWRKEGVPFFRAREIVSLAKDGKVDNELFIDEKTYEEYTSKYGKPMEGDIMITGVGTLGICYLVKSTDRFYFKDGNIIWMKSQKKCVSRFIQEQFRFDFVINQILENSSGSTVGTYTINNAKSTRVLLPPNNLQIRFVSFVTSMDKLKFNLQRAIDKAKKMSAKILNDALSTEE